MGRVVLSSYLLCFTLLLPQIPSLPVPLPSAEGFPSAQEKKLWNRIFKLTLDMLEKGREL
jgi:hypothetical protein